MILNLCIVVIEGLIVGIPCYLMFRNHNRRMRGPVFLHVPVASPFKVSAYLARMEKVHLDLLKEHQPVDGTITLWLGLEGLRINPDGTSVWIRRDPVPAPFGFVPPSESSGLYGAPDPLYRLPTPPPRGVEYLYADNAIAACCCGPVETILQTLERSMDQQRADNEIKRLEAQLDQFLKKQDW